MLVPTIHLAVKTQDGEDVGKVFDVVWDADSFVIVQIKVKRSVLDRHPLLIHASQIVAVHKDAVIIERGAREQALGNGTRVTPVSENGAAASLSRVEDH